MSPREFIFRRGAGLLSLLGVAGTLFLFVWSQPGLASSYDFSAYYCSFHSFYRGRNPYDSAALAACQESLGLNHGFTPALMWYGPWAFPLFLPFLSWSYSVSGAIWFCSQFFLAVLTAWFIWSAASADQRRFGIAIAASLCFYPLKEVLEWQQMGLFLTAGLALFIWAESRSADFLAGAALVPLTLKPHLFLLLLPAVVAWYLRVRRWRVLASLLAAVALLTAIAELRCPGISAWWLDRIGTPPLYLQTPTLVGLIRNYLYSATGTASTLPALLIPLGAVVSVTLWLIRRRPPILWLPLVARLLPISIFLAPYANTHDFALLLITQIWALSLALREDVFPPRRLISLGLLGALQLLALVLHSHWFPFAWQTFWFPVAMFAVLVFVQRFSQPCRVQKPAVESNPVAKWTR